MALESVSEADLAAILEHYDIFDPDHEKVRQELFAYAREKCPVARTDANGGFWLVTRYDDVKTVLGDWETFSSLESPPLPSPMKLCPIDSDPPVQQHARRLLNPALSRSGLAHFEPRMRVIARELIEQWVDRGHVELMSEYAGPFVAKNLAEVVFNDLTDEELERARDVSLRATEESSPEVWTDLGEMCADYLAKARAKSEQNDGILKLLTTGDFGDRPPTEEEQLGVLGILFLGGLDTTRSAIGSIAFRLTQEPKLEARVRDPKWTRQDLDEFLRLDAPVGCMARTATRDTVLNGTRIAKGDRLLVRYDSANRDESRFENASKLVFDEPRGGHASFGLGVHRCIGSNLARMQIEIAYDEMFKRITNLRLPDGAEVEWAAGIGNAIRSLPVTFDRVDQ